MNIEDIRKITARESLSGGRWLLYSFGSFLKVFSPSLSKFGKTQQNGTRTKIVVVSVAALLSWRLCFQGPLFRDVNKYARRSRRKFWTLALSFFCRESKEE